MKPSSFAAADAWLIFAWALGVIFVSHWLIVPVVVLALWVMILDLTS